MLIFILNKGQLTCSSARAHNRSLAVIHRHPGSPKTLEFQLVEYKGISSKSLTKVSWELQHRVNVRFCSKDFHKL